MLNVRKIEEEEEEDSGGSSESSSDTRRDDNKNLELSGQDKVLISAGSSEEAILKVKNIGSYQLNCEVTGDWISTEEKIEYLDKTDEVDVNYIVNVPAGTAPGDYSKEIMVDCNGGISESTVISVTVLAGESSITGDVITEESETGAGITGGVIGAGGGKFIAYIVFLLVLAGAVVLVWKKHAQIKGLDGLVLRGRNWFSNIANRIHGKEQ
jgi:hypothetical protein